jgi:hypothetical protein
VILVDTGPLVAAADADEEHHRACVDLFADLRSARQPLLISPLVIAEVAYMLSRFGGSVAEAEFLRSIRAGEFELLALTSTDLDRMIELVETYADMGLGSTDASVIALAERLGVTDVATLDRRHFGAVRPSHVVALTLLPDVDPQLRTFRHVPRRHAGSTHEDRNQSHLGITI